MILLYSQYYYQLVKFSIFNIQYLIFNVNIRQVIKRKLSYLLHTLKASHQCKQLVLIAVRSGVTHLEIVGVELIMRMRIWIRIWMNGKNGKDKKYKDKDTLNPNPYL